MLDIRNHTTRSRVRKAMLGDLIVINIVAFVLAVNGCRRASVHNLVGQEGQQSVGNRGGQTMERNAAQGDHFAAYLSGFTPLAGDRRTAWLLDAMVRGETTM